MKKTRMIITGIVLAAAAHSLHAQSFLAGIGADFVRYDRTYLDLRAAYLEPLNPGVELLLGGSFATVTEKKNGDVEPDFFIPLDAGVVFTFPVNDTFAYQFGLGVTVQFLIQTDSRFYMGPYVGLGVRFGVHPYMEWYIEGRQDLIFGEPDWINTSTRLSTGVVFKL
jgi:hypothetical protein